ncbi:uncharacterized protein LOC110034991 [Phalaenopsis equestris]|uniref:uncharacterized protein LOC110034991 n=1 Tax=Phalaenopsis equestris TaxID=78828 RepID=UPI0009E330A4|nr:uncharacterized protein LOC110034991 [Phalaenopsis equestris]
MAQQPSLTSHSYNSSLKASCQSLKIKTHVEAFILRHLCRLVRALSNTKSFIIKLLTLTTAITSKKTSISATKMHGKKKKKMMKRVLKSITMWCNMPSTHVIPISEPAISFQGLKTISQTFYDSTWNSIVVVSDDDASLERQLSGYLEWLEENEPGNDGGGNDDVDDAGEIDQLAEKFIASCHEKFRLEKQESYRRYQEMLARSM